MAEKKTRHFQMRTSDEFLSMLDDWRVKHRPVLSRAGAIHELVSWAITKRHKLRTVRRRETGHSLG
jgi:hypothetical protein